MIYFWRPYFGKVYSIFLYLQKYDVNINKSLWMKIQQTEAKKEGRTWQKVCTNTFFILEKSFIIPQAWLPSKSDELFSIIDYFLCLIWVRLIKPTGYELINTKKNNFMSDQNQMFILSCEKECKWHSVLKTWCTHLQHTICIKIIHHACGYETSLWRVTQTQWILLI